MGAGDGIDRSEAYLTRALKLEQMARKWNGPPPIVLPDSGLDLEQMGRKGKGSPPLPQP